MNPDREPTAYGDALRASETVDPRLVRHWGRLEYTPPRPTADALLVAFTAPHSIPVARDGDAAHKVEHHTWALAREFARGVAEHGAGGADGAAAAAAAAARGEAALHQAWDLYSSVHRRVKRQIGGFDELELAHVAPALVAARDLQLAVPGTYAANALAGDAGGAGGGERGERDGEAADYDAVVRIAEFAPRVKVMPRNAPPDLVALAEKVPASSSSARLSR